MNDEFIIKALTALLVNKGDLYLSSTSIAGDFISPIIHNAVMGDDHRELHIIGIEFVIVSLLRYLINMETTLFDTAIDVGAVSGISLLYKSL